MVQLSNSSHNTSRRKVASQVPTQTIPNQMFLPAGKSKRKATNGEKYFSVKI